eukprot:3936981-Rhodomonas_salina.2
MATKKDFIVAMEEEHNDINTFEAFNHGELRVTSPRLQWKCVCKKEGDLVKINPFTYKDSLQNTNYDAQSCPPKRPAQDLCESVGCSDFMSHPKVIESGLIEAE